MNQLVGVVELVMPLPTVTPDSTEPELLDAILERMDAVTEALPENFARYVSAGYWRELCPEHDNMAELEEER